MEKNGDFDSDYSCLGRKMILTVGNIDHPGVDVIITIFCDFCQFSAKKIGVFLKNQCYGNFLN
jgi:hypothetical protein